MARLFPTPTGRLQWTVLWIAQRSRLFPGRASSSFSGNPIVRAGVRTQVQVQFSSLDYSVDYDFIAGRLSRERSSIEITMTDNRYGEKNHTIIRRDGRELSLVNSLGLLFLRRRRGKKVGRTAPTETHRVNDAIASYFYRVIKSSESSGVYTFIE